MSAISKDVEYKKSPSVTFTISEKNVEIQETGQDLGRARSISQRTQQNEEEGKFPFLLLVGGGCIGGIVLLVVLTSVLISIKINFCKKDRLLAPTSVSDMLDTEVSQLSEVFQFSHREDRVISLLKKTSNRK